MDAAAARSARRRFDLGAVEDREHTSQRRFDTLLKIARGLDTSFETLLDEAVRGAGRAG